MTTFAPTTTVGLVIERLRLRIVQVQEEQHISHAERRSLIERQHRETDALEQHRIAVAIAEQERDFFQQHIDLLTRIIDCRQEAAGLNALSPLRQRAAHHAVQEHLSSVLAEQQRHAEIAALPTLTFDATVSQLLDDTEKRRAITRPEDIFLL